MKKTISFLSVILFILPVITLLVCHQLHAAHTGFHTIPFIDGKVSVSLIGRQEYTIGIFKPSFILYILLSITFYKKISDFFFQNNIKNKFKLSGILANTFLFIYILALGKDGYSYEISRRLGIILFIGNMYINHINLIKLLKIARNKSVINFNNIYLIIFYSILAIMTILVIIGLPWVNPLFKYPDQLKNIIEWNFFLLTIFFYIPLSVMFYQLSPRIK